MRPSTVLFLSILVLAHAFPLAPAARALQPYRVADVDPTFHSGSSRPRNFVRVGRRTLFTAYVKGLGLWSTNGTAAGTVRLLNNQYSILNMVAAGELLFFTGCDLDQLCRMYITDGTVAGTHAFGRMIGYPIEEGDVVAAGPRRFYFSFGDFDTVAGNELWTSDGTVAGTRRVKDIDPGFLGSLPRNLVWFRDRLWFFTGGSLWTSDGTANGTRTVAAVGGSPVAAGVAGSRLVFLTQDLDDQFRFWGSDGTAQGTKVMGGPPFTASSSLLGSFTTAGSNTFFFFEAEQDAERQLWVTDGTTARTRKLASFGPSEVDPRRLVAGSRIAFVAGDAAHGRELWVSDGRPEGTRGIDVCPGPCSGVRELGAADGNRIWFAGTGATGGEELWLSDLTPNGTRRVKDIVPGALSSSPRGFYAGDGRVFFSVTGPVGFPNLWTSNGTAAGTRLLVNQGPSDSLFDPRPGVVVEGRAFFGLNDADHGNEPWVSDGTVAGTALIADVEPDQDGGSFPEQLMPAGGRCFFASANGGAETELWVSDGSTEGTALVSRFAVRNDVFTHGLASYDLGGRLVLSRREADPSSDLWISDGTAEGTFSLTLGELRYIDRVRVVGGRLFFIATDSVHGTEMWTSDGSVTGTLRLTDFANPRPFPFGERGPLREVRGRIAFLAADELGGLEPWVSDGTIGGTRHLAEVYPALVAPFSELSSEVVEVQGKLFFVSGEQSEIGTQPALWISDLTEAGTRKVADLPSNEYGPTREVAIIALANRVLVFYEIPYFRGFVSSNGSGLQPGATVGLKFETAPIVWGNRVVYFGEDGRLYMTDGTAVGTRTQKFPNGRLVAASAVAVLGGRLAFAADTGIWDTDGTPAGTKRRLPLYSSAVLRDFVRSGERIFFPWYDAEAGTELWALRP
ncbi:MAG: hypothetical protein ABJC13_10230 [Acidobacteriota bacterium]